MRITAAMTSLLALTLSGCGSTETCGDGSPYNDLNECPCEDGLYPADHDDGQCPADGPECDFPLVLDPDTDTCKTECSNGDLVDNESECAVNLNPVAVGFEYEGGFRDGEWASWAADDGQGGLVDIPPVIYLTFADMEYFSDTTVEAQVNHNCQVWGVVDTELSIGTSIPTNGGAVWSSWDLALTIDPTSWNNANNPENCAALLDEDLWGVGGADLLAAFDGMHLGIGFGPVTQTITDAWSEENLTAYGDAMFAEYIGMNDASGAFVGEDWTTGLMFQWDDTTGAPLVVDNAYVTADISTATSLPNGFIRSAANWYQDFPLLDLTNLKDGAPAR